MNRQGSRSFAIAAVLFVLALVVDAQTIVAPGRVNTVITITSGTPIQVTTNKTVTADRLLIQSLTGGSGIVQICIVKPGVTPSAKGGGSGQLAAQLAPASSTAPGGSYSDVSPASQTAGILLNTIFIDGTHSGDTVVVSYNVR
jgi:hypothetical protein